MPYPLRLLTLALAFLIAAPVAAQIEMGEKGYVYNPRKGDDHGKRKSLQIERIKAGMRDDQLWHAEAANVSYRQAGNVSLLSASRYGLSEKVELSTYLALDVLRPVVYVKALWKVFDKRWFLASRFDAANAYPGMSLAQSLGVSRVISDTADIPTVFELGHEILLSRAWFSDMNCSDGSAYLILTAGLGCYFGYNFSDAPDLDQVRFHFLANRGETLTGTGWRGRLKFWADGRINARLFLHGGIAYHFGSFSHHHAVELQGEGEYFFHSRLSAKLGFLTSFGNYARVDKNAAIWPIIDVTYYFGKKDKSDKSSLFKRGVYKGSRGGEII
ncbi:MAG: hypothetical protein II375_09360 [Bacteroidales bacterium]|nr:hypothetical protein [Bacteroidales bacterium]